MKLVIGMAALCLSVCSCQQQQAAWKIRHEMAQRAQASDRSMQLYEQGRAAQADNKIDEAKKLYNEAVNSDENNIYAWISLGEVEMQMEHYYGAAEAFHRASRLAPSRYEPRYDLGCVFEAAGRYADAAREYEAALRLAPDQIEVMENLARTYITAGHEMDRAHELAQKALVSEERPEWRAWLLLQSVRLPATTQASQSDATATSLRSP